MKKRSLTLLEIMIVILLITIIAGVIGYNMKGALEKGRAFRTERAMDQLRDLLLYRLAEGADVREILENVPKAVESTLLAKDAKSLTEDGWGVPFEVKYIAARNDFRIVSKKFEAYRAKTQPRSTDLSRDADEEDF